MSEKFGRDIEELNLEKAFIWDVVGAAQWYLDPLKGEKMQKLTFNDGNVILPFLEFLTSSVKTQHFFLSYEVP